MEYFYTAYTKSVDNKKYYFVKKFVRFPEYAEVPDVLAGYGMHTEFEKACSIAEIDNSAIRIQLLNEIEPMPLQAKLIEMRPAHVQTGGFLSQFMHMFRRPVMNRKLKLGEPLAIRHHHFFRKTNHH